jgi:hypothetical protein
MTYGFTPIIRMTMYPVNPIFPELSKGRLFTPPPAYIDSSTPVRQERVPRLSVFELVEDLRDDEKSVAFAIDHMERMEDRLARKLVMIPSAKRFIHAYIITREGRVHLAPLVVPVLMERLRDNFFRDDALMSMEALFRLLVAAIPWLREALADADEKPTARAVGLLRVQALAVTTSFRS